MTTLTLRYDSFDEDFLSRHPLPILEKIGVGVRMHEALDKAASLRQIVAIIGAKGLGKSLRLDAAVEWFDERERRRHALDNSYAQQIVRVIRNLRNDSYDDVLVTLLHALDKREPVRENGRRRPASVLRKIICAKLKAKHVAVLVLDECEVISPRTMEVLRDVMALSADLAREAKGAHGEDTPSGVGVLLVGSPDAESLLRGSEEFGQRMVEMIRLTPLAIGDATRAMGAWLPASDSLVDDSVVRWQTLVRLNVCHDRETTMRHLKNVVMEYARRLDRARRLVGATSWAEVPIDFDVLAAVAADILPPDLGNNARGRRGR